MNIKGSLAKLSLYYLTGNGSRKIFSDIDITLLPGVYLLRGENGSGKSSLLRLLAGNLLPTSGTLTWTNSDEVVQPKIFLNYYPDSLGDLTAGEFLRLLCCDNNIKYSSAVKKEVARLLPIESLWKKRIRDLSGADRQKIELIPLLVGDFDVVLLDEAFKFLDNKTCLRLKDYLLHRYIDRIVVITDHTSRLDYQEDYCLEFDGFGLKVSEKIDAKREASGSKDERLLLKTSRSKNRFPLWATLSSHVGFYLTAILISLLSLILPLSASLIEAKTLTFNPIVTLEGKEIPAAIADKFEPLSFDLEAIDPDGYEMSYNDVGIGRYQLRLDPKLKGSEIAVDAPVDLDKRGSLTIMIQNDDTFYDSHYSIPYVNVIRSKKNKDRSFTIFLSPELFDIFASVGQFFAEFQVLSHDFTALQFYVSDEEKAVASLPISDLKILNSKTGSLHTVETIHEPGLSKDYSTLLFSTGLIKKVLAEQDYQTVLFRSKAEYDQIISLTKTSKNLTVKDDYRFFLSAQREKNRLVVQLGVTNYSLLLLSLLGLSWRSFFLKAQRCEIHFPRLQYQRLKAVLLCSAPVLFMSAMVFLIIQAYLAALLASCTLILLGIAYGFYFWNQRRKQHV